MRRHWLGWANSHQQINGMGEKWGENPCNCQSNHPNFQALIITIKKIGRTFRQRNVDPMLWRDHACCCMECQCETTTFIDREKILCRGENLMPERKSYAGEKILCQRENVDWVPDSLELHPEESELHPEQRPQGGSPTIAFHSGQYPSLRFHCGGKERIMMIMKKTSLLFTDLSWLRTGHHDLFASMCSCCSDCFDILLPCYPCHWHWQWVMFPDLMQTTYINLSFPAPLGVPSK